MAASTAFTFRPDRAGQDRLMHDPNGPVGQYLTRLCNRVVNGAVVRANVDTGLMRSRIESRVEVRAGRLVGIVAARTSYAVYVHNGNGTYPGNPFLTDSLREALGR